MIIAVGSKNSAKLDAVRNFFSVLSDISSFSVEGFDVDSQVSAQPKTLDETMSGAANRARAAYELKGHFWISIGIEGGLMPVDKSITGYMNICSACIFDGQNYFYGLSSAFEHPTKAIKLVLEEGLEIKDAYTSAGFEDSAEFARQGGAIGFVTDQVLSRSEYCKQALLTAYFTFKKKDLFSHA